MSEDIITDIELEMTISIEHLIEEFGKIRTGRANPNLVTSIQVDYYGTKTPLQQLASVSVPDPRLLVIQPFDKSSFEEIEKGDYPVISSSGISYYHNEGFCKSPGVVLGRKGSVGTVFLSEKDYHRCRL